MYALLPYVWILFMVGLVAAVITVSMMERPKKAAKKAPVQGSESGADPLSESEPILDFGDEMAQMEKK